jgi:hypothetical protein
MAFKVGRALVLILISTTSAFGAVLSNGDLAKECTQKTIVLSPKGEAVGETINAFFSGYLQAYFHTLLTNPKIKCTSILVTDQSPESLLSIYLTYQKDKNVASSVAAASTLLSAYERAFGCGDN